MSFADDFDQFAEHRIAKLLERRFELHEIASVPRSPYDPMYVVATAAINEIYQIDVEIEELNAKRAMYQQRAREESYRRDGLLLRAPREMPKPQIKQPKPWLNNRRFQHHAKPKPTPTESCNCSLATAPPPWQWTWANGYVPFSELRDVGDHWLEKRRKAKRQGIRVWEPQHKQPR